MLTCTVYSKPQNCKKEIEINIRNGWTIKEDQRKIMDGEIVIIKFEKPEFELKEGE